MKDNHINDLITIAEARSLLTVSHTEMAQMIKNGVIRYFPNPLDGRVKLVGKAEVQALIPRRAEAA